MNIELVHKIIILNPFHFDISSLEGDIRSDCNLLNSLNLNLDQIQDLFRNMFPKVYIKKDNIKVLFINNLRFNKEK